MNEKQILESIREEVLQGAPSGSATFIASVGINESIFKHAGQLLENPSNAAQIMSDLTDAIHYLTQYRDRVIERFDAPQQIVPRLVRILETFANGTANLALDVASLRRKLFTFVTLNDDGDGAIFRVESEVMTHKGADWFARPGEYELVNPADASKARVGDKVRHLRPYGVEAISRVVRVNNGNPTNNLKSWRLELCSAEEGDHTGKTYVKSADNCTLVSSDTPLG